MKRSQRFGFQSVLWACVRGKRRRELALDVAAAVAARDAVCLVACCIASHCCYWNSGSSWNLTLNFSRFATVFQFFDKSIRITLKKYWLVKILLNQNANIWGSQDCRMKTFCENWRPNFTRQSTFNQKRLVKAKQTEWCFEIYVQYEAKILYDGSSYAHNVHQLNWRWLF